LFDPPALVMRELCERGAIGDPVHVESIYGYDLSGPFGRALMADRMHWVHKLPGKLLHNTVDHMLNKVVEFVDSDEPDVLALARPLADPSLLDELRVILGGRRVTAYASFSAHARPVVHQARVHGTRNTMLVDYVARTVTLAHAPPLPSAVGRLLAPLPAAGDLVREVARNAVRFARSDYHFFAGLHELMRRFYASIHDGRPPPISARDILWVSSVMERIFDEIGPRVRLYPTERVA
jgi:predicted dehydrogenase